MTGPVTITRRAWLTGATLGLAGLTNDLRAAPVGDAAGFRAVIETIRARALAEGLAPAGVDAALAGLDGPDPRIVALSRRQAEFSRPLAAYLAAAAGPARVARGRDLARVHAALLATIAHRFDVPGAIVLAVWGLESEFGTAAGGFEVPRALATLVWLGHRAPLFADEFVAALRILDEEPIGRAAMLGSWAVAMGQVQFLPSTFLRAAIDQDGDGRRDIWRSVPDSLASIAHLLALSGWQRDLPAAFEVTLPPDADLATHRDTLAGWAARRVVRADGQTMPSRGDAQLFLPAGIAGPAFLLTPNFEAIRAYNTSDAYALAIVRLADGIAGGGPLTRPWPPDPGLTGPERTELQTRLAARGLYAGVPDGRLGARTRDAVRLFQLERGLVPDGFADAALLRALRTR